MPKQPANPPAAHDNIATVALKYIGFPYIFGSCFKQGGWDCSSAVNYWVSQAGYRIPGGGNTTVRHMGRLQAAYLTWGKHVPMIKLKPVILLSGPGPAR